MVSKLGTLLSKILVFMLILLVSCLLYLNFVYTVDNAAFLYVIIIIPLFVLCCIISVKLNISTVAFTFLILGAAFFLKGIFAILVNTLPISDFETFYQNAIRLANGDKSFGHTFYFKTWAYQTGPILYYAIIMKFFGTGLLPLKVVNCIFMAGSNTLIYLISKKVSNEITARFVALLYLIYPAPYFTTSVLTNQHFAACLFLTAIYFLLIKRINPLISAVLSGLAMAVGNVVRPIGLVIISAVMIWGIVELIRSLEIMKLCTVSLTLIVYVSVGALSSATVKHLDINPEGLANNFPLWKFVVGSNYEANGQFSLEDENNIFYVKDFSKRNEISVNIIKERYSVGATKLTRLLKNKFKIMWVQFDTLRWEFFEQKNGEIHPSKEIKNIEPIVLKTEKCFYMLILLLLLVGLCSTYKNKKIQPGIILITTLLLCYFGAHALIEIQVRYRYFAVLLFFVLASKGSEGIFLKLNENKNKTASLLNSQN